MARWIASGETHTVAPMVALRRLSLALALAALVPASRALAYEDAVELAVSAGYAARFGGGEALALPDHGMTFAGTVGLGLNDAWSLRVTGLNQVYFPAPTFRRSALFFEASYALDVVKVVPVFGAGVGAGLEGFGGQREFAPAFTAFLSIDVLLSREVLVGPEIRVLALPFAGVEGAGDLSLAASFRFAYLWDRF